MSRLCWYANQDRNIRRARLPVTVAALTPGFPRAAAGAGARVGGAAVSFLLPEDGPNGTFANGLRTEVVATDARGRATVPPIQLNRMPGRFGICILASKDE